MARIASRPHRRGFLKTALSATAAAVMAPTIIPSSALGRDGAVAPSERITVGGIGIGNRGTYDLGCFLEQPDVQFVAVCDVKQARRDAVKKIADEHHGTQDCDTYRDFRELLDRDDIDAVLIATGPNWHATMAMYAARAGKDMYCEKPCTKNIAQSLNLVDTMRRTGRVFQVGHAAAQPAALRVRLRIGSHREARQAEAGLRSPDWDVGADERLAARPNRADPKVVDWNMYLGPAAWRPYNAKLLDGFNFEKGGGLVGGGVLEWGSHCVDLCQWAVDADGQPPVEYNPPANKQIVARYANGVELIFREEGLDAAWFVPGAVRRRDRLGRDGRQRQAGAQLARAVGRPQGRGDRRLPGDVPCPRLPRLREDAQPAEGERRGGVLRSHRLPRGEHRARAQSVAEVRPGEA